MAIGHAAEGKLKTLRNAALESATLYRRLSDWVASISFGGGEEHASEAVISLHGEVSRWRFWWWI